MSKELYINEAVLKMGQYYPLGKFNVGLNPIDMQLINKEKILPGVQLYSSVYISEGDFYINHYEPVKDKIKTNWLKRFFRWLF